MKYLKLYESFNEIESICNKYGIENYTINADGYVDVDGDVNLNHESLKELPLKFRKVTGIFVCIDNELTSLEGCPKYVGGGFYCMYNKLTSLEGAPESVGGNFDCSHNQLISLEGSPKHISDHFLCDNNQLTSLEGGPQHIGGIFNCADNQLTSLEGAPEKVDGDFACSRNKLISLEHFPQVGGEVYLYETPIYAIWELFKDKDKIELFNDYDVVRDNKIIIDRLNEFLQEIGKPLVKSVKGYNNI